MSNRNPLLEAADQLIDEYSLYLEGRPDDNAWTFNGFYSQDLLRIVMYAMEASYSPWAFRIKPAGTLYYLKGYRHKHQ